MKPYLLTRAITTHETIPPNKDHNNTWNHTDRQTDRQTEKHSLYHLSGHHRTNRPQPYPWVITILGMWSEIVYIAVEDLGCDMRCWPFIIHDVSIRSLSNLTGSLFTTYVTKGRRVLLRDVPSAPSDLGWSPSGRLPKLSDKAAPNMATHSLNSTTRYADRNNVCYHHLHRRIIVHVNWYHMSTCMAICLVSWMMPIVYWYRVVYCRHPGMDTPVGSYVTPP